MSTSDTPTPETDLRATTLPAGTFGPGNQVSVEIVPAEFARQLERELAAAQARIAELETQLEAHAWKVSPAMAQAQIDQLNARIAELERDRARLDWLEANPIAVQPIQTYAGLEQCFYIQTTRAAIDAAMAPPPNTLPHA